VSSVDIDAAEVGLEAFDELLVPGDLAVPAALIGVVAELQSCLP
jgi:hypothetical protein